MSAALFLLQQVSAGRPARQRRFDLSEQSTEQAVTLAPVVSFHTMLTSHHPTPSEPIEGTTTLAIKSSRLSKRPSRSFKRLLVRILLTRVVACQQPGYKRLPKLFSDGVVETVMMACIAKREAAEKVGISLIPHDWNGNPRSHQLCYQQLDSEMQLMIRISCVFPTPIDSL
jgi:hypothetical protein